MIKLGSRTIFIVFIAISLCFNSCVEEKEYFYSSEKKLITHLFHLSLNDIKAVSYRISDESMDSLLSPPVIDPCYKIVGIIYLDDSYKKLDINQVQKDIVVQYPPSIASQDWGAPLKSNHKLMQGHVNGAIYYSHSLHAFYFEVYDHTS